MCTLLLADLACGLGPGYLWTRNRACEACLWTYHGLVDLVAHGPGFTLLRPGLQVQLLLADMLGAGHSKQAA